MMSQCRLTWIFSILLILEKDVSSILCGFHQQFGSVGGASCVITLHHDVIGHMTWGASWQWLLGNVWCHQYVCSHVTQCHSEQVWYLFVIWSTVLVPCDVTGSATSHQDVVALHCNPLPKFGSHTCTTCTTLVLDHMQSLLSSKSWCSVQSIPK